MSEVPKTRRSEYSGASRDLQQQIDELRSRIAEVEGRPWECPHEWSSEEEHFVCVRCGEVR